MYDTPPITHQQTKAIFHPVTISTCLYIIAAIFAAVEYYFTLFSSTRIPQISNHSQKQPRRDVSPLDIGESMHSVVRLPPPPPSRSPGEENRRLFYKYLLLSLVLRLIFLPIQLIYSSDSEDSTGNQYDVTTIVARSLPSLTSMISYTILICFYAQVTYMASGKQKSYQYNVTIPWIQNTMAQIVYTIYSSVIFCNTVVPILSNQVLGISIWTMLCIFHSCLLITMSYFGIKLIRILDSSVSGGLGQRLIGMCVVCVITFAMRTFIDALDLFKVFTEEQQQPRENILLPQFGLYYFDKQWNSSFGRDVMGLIAMEWLPAMIVLVMMHKPHSKSTSGNNLDVSNSNGLRRYFASHDESMSAVEQGGDNPVFYEQQHGQQQPILSDVKGKSIAVGIGGVTRSFSANGGVPGHRQQSANQRAIASSYGMAKTGSGLASSNFSGKGAESIALLGERYSSNISGFGINQSYGGTSSQED